MFLGIYPFLLGYTICWHIIVEGNVEGTNEEMLVKGDKISLILRFGSGDLNTAMWLLTTPFCILEIHQEDWSCVLSTEETERGERESDNYVEWRI